jgi:hypothetical protein
MDLFELVIYLEEIKILFLLMNLNFYFVKIHFIRIVCIFHRNLIRATSMHFNNNLSVSKYRYILYFID